MERIKQSFQSRVGQSALIPFLTAGDPTFEDSLQLFRALLRAGADVIEIGIPYSDPLADGPVIQAAALRSLSHGFTLPRAFELTAALRKETNKALILFTYVNPLLQYGYDKFFRDAASAGADGVIVPDLPYEESSPVRAYADAANVALIPLVTPTSGAERIEAIAKQARGFVYCVSSLGVTGERAQMSARVQDSVRTVRQFTSLPVAVGFGVSSVEQARYVSTFADGVIVGSALVRRVEESTESPSASTVSRVEDFCKELSQAVVGDKIHLQEKEG